MMERIVLIAAIPSAPPSTADCAGMVISVMLGVIFAQTGIEETSLTQPTTSSVISQD